VRFEWDSKKAAANLKKHKVSFDEAVSVFADPHASIFDDEAHSNAEPRETIIGHSILNRIVLVCFTELERDVVRILTARLATRREREDYEENSNR
jgi:uncharacterized DUF497 family protein